MAMDVGNESLIDQEDFLNTIFSVDDTSYLTHNFHPWAAKFIPQVPRYFIERFTMKGDIVYDPFCGSGTTLVEALLLGRNAYGNDINHIAALASKAKTTPLSTNQVAQVLAWRSTISTLKQQWQYLARSGALEDHTDAVKFANKMHWFDKDVLAALMEIKTRIDGISDPAIRTFLLSGFSSIVVRSSRQESETRYAAIEKRISVDLAFDMFLNKIDDMVERMKSFTSSTNAENWARIFQADTRAITAIPDGSIQLVLTSPPYANTYDYYLYHKLRMYLLGYDVDVVRVNEIGSRNRYSSQKQDIKTFLADMITCFGIFHRLLKADGHLVIVIGDSIVSKKRYSGLDLISEIARKTGFCILQSFSYMLDDISKLFNKRFRQKDKAEWIVILSKY